MNTQQFTLKLSSNAFRDLKREYEFLVSRFENTPYECPAVLFLDSSNSVLLEDENGTSIAVLDRNSTRLLGDLKRALSRPAEVIDSNQAGCLSSLFYSECNYWIWYKWLLETCKHLDIAVPALFICDKMPSFISNLRGVCFPGGEVPYVTDVFIKLKKGEDMGLCIKTLLHELRHVWQHKCHNDWFSGYASFREEEADDYYRRYVEIDADAFAYLTLQNHGLSYILEDLGLARSKRIRERIAEIASDQPLYLSNLRAVDKP